MNAVPHPTAQGEAAEFRWSATVLLTHAQGWYLVRRNPKLSYFPDYWALPGGQVDADVDGPGPPDAGWERTLRACALRELLEEVGVAPEQLSAKLAAPHELRRELLAGGERERAAGRRLRALLDEVPAVFDALGVITWATTPRSALRRYRTLYFELELPRGAEPAVVDGELVEGRWFQPTELLASWLRGGVRLVPPLVALLEEFERAAGVWPEARAAAHARSRQVDGGALHVVDPVPGIAMAPLRTRTIPPATTTNCYLVGRERVFVVDPGCVDGKETERLLAYLESHRPERLAGVFVTHHHPDHTGAVAEVSMRFELDVYAHPFTLARIPGPLHGTQALHEGDVLDLGLTPDGSGAWHADVYETPGHSNGHLCLVESHNRALVAGDLVSTLSTIVIDPPEGHLATYLASLARMAALAPGPLLPAHGMVASDSGIVLAAYLRHRAARESKLVRALDEFGPSTLAALVPVVYDDAPEALRGLAERSLLAGLIKLGEDGRAIQEGDHWRLLGARETALCD